MTEQEDLIDLAHTIIIRMSMRGGHDSYTGVLMVKWLRMYESRPTQRATDWRDAPVKSDGSQFDKDYPVK